MPEPAFSTAKRLNEEYWYAMPDEEEESGWVLTTSNGIVVGGFVAELHAKRVMVEHNRWVNRHTAAIEYRRGFRWAIAATISAIITGALIVGTVQEREALLLGGIGLVVTGVCLIAAVMRRIRGE